jgi:hypothetical protein
MSKECNRCLNVESYDTLMQQRISITPNGLCNQCIEWDQNSEEFNNYRLKAREQLPKIFDEVKKEKHQYDALVSLSGGKDSSVALILAKEKYHLNVLAFTTDKGNFYDGIRENIIQLTDNLGVDHVFIKTPKPLLTQLYRFGLTTLSTAGVQCKMCGGLVHLPIFSRFLLNYDVKVVITGLDLWEIQAAHTYETKRNQPLINPFLYTTPALRERWNRYQLTIDDCLGYLKQFAKESDFPQLKTELLEIANGLIARYGLSSSEIERFNKLNFYEIGLTGIEISNKKEQLEILNKYGWKPARHMFTGEIIGTDCKIGGVINALNSLKFKRKIWSYQIRSGLVTKQEALDEINKKAPNIAILCQSLKDLGLKKLENRLSLGWKNNRFKDLYNLEVIEEINRQLDSSQ